MDRCPECGRQASDSSSCEWCGSAFTIGHDDQDDTAVLVEPRIGIQIDKYRTIDVLGIGGSSIVYVAEHVKLGRRVALKVLNSTDPDDLARHFAEARLVNRIKHPNIIEITDFIEVEGGDNCLVMELVDGVTLRQLLYEGGALPVKRVIGIATQMCDALNVAHTAGVIHRDLKPSNIFIARTHTGEDLVKVLDFGIAKSLGNDLGIDLTATQTGVIVGTPHYMSPEQCRGQPLTHHTDIYSFGVMLFGMATGALPFRGHSVGDIIYKHTSVAPPRPSDLTDAPEKVPRGLEELILACLMKDPTSRPGSMSEVRTALLSIDASEAPKRYPRRRILWATSAGALFGGFFALGMALTSPQSGDPAPEAAPSALEATAAPPPPAARAAAEKVAIRISSSPAGAQVFVANPERYLGTTPFSRAFDISGEPVEIEFRLASHRTTRQLLALDADQTIEVDLLPDGREPAAQKAPEAAVTNAPAPSPTQDDDTAEPRTDLRDPWAP